MPIFEFHCNDCGKDFEKLVFGSDNDINCPGCEKTNVEKLMSSCAFKVGQNFTSTSAKAAGGASCGSCSSSNCSSCG